MSMLLSLFLVFAQIGVLSFGGGYVAVPLIQSQAVDTWHWLTMAEFTDLLTIAQMTPGPIAVNAATFAGSRIAGLPGVMAATFGCVLPSLVIVTVMGLLYRRYRKLQAMQTILSVLRPVVVALIAAAFVKILLSAVFPAADIASADILAAALFLAAIVAIRRFRVNAIAVMVACGVVYMGVGLLFG